MTVQLVLAGFMAGALNSVAGGGSFITLPVLLYWGVPPVAANATSTLGLWPASLASGLAYRDELAAIGRPIVWLTVASLAGGWVGGRLLVETSDTSFLRLLPWLMLAAAMTFTFGGELGAGPRRFKLHRARWWALPLQAAISIYGGYFGGGMGIMMLAVFSASGMTNIHEMNGVKSMLAVAINSVALAEFISHGAIRWGPGLTTAVGGIVGGYAGAWMARRLNRHHVRQFVTIVGWTMTAYFFLR
jgi:uncharacterized membrane protein YfcA